MPPFSLIILPDPQKYTAYDPGPFLAQIQWIRRNMKKENIQFVSVLGDMTENNSPEQWERAQDIINQLDGIVPYHLVGGNHDMGLKGQALTRDTSLFNTYFPLQRFMHKSWFGGSMDKSYDNHFCFFNVGQMEFMIMGLEFAPREETLQWANHLIDKHKNKRIIIITHCYLSSDNKRVCHQHGHNYTPDDYALAQWEEVSDGEEIWNKLVKRHPNIFLVLSGHVSESGGTGYLKSRGLHGNIVHQLLIDYTQIGKGWFRILKFVPHDNKIYVLPYSPFLDNTSEAPLLIDPRHNFEINYLMF